MEWQLLGNAMVGLVPVAAALLVLRWVAHRLGLINGRQSSGHIRVIESRPISRRTVIHLVQVGEEQFLIGSSDGGVPVIHEVSPGRPPTALVPAAVPRLDLLKTLGTAALVLGLLVLLPSASHAEEAARVVLELPESLAMGGSAIEMLALLTIIAIAPSILLMATCFTRFIIVLAFVRQAIGVQHMPPNQVMIGLALFLTAFVMQPLAEQVIGVAYDPFVAGELSGREALAAASEPISHFLLSQTREQDLALFMDLSRMGAVSDPSEIPLSTLLPSFLVSELKTAFEIGFVVFLPFLIIDLIVSSLLISMGMIVLPPIVVSLPFKIMLFVLVDGWNLILGSLVQGIA